MLRNFVLIFILHICFREAVLIKEVVESELEAIRVKRDPCVKAVDACLRGKLRNGEVSGYNEENSQKAMAECTETHKCSIAKTRLCYSFRFEKTKKPWMTQKCSSWGATIPPYEVLPDY